MTPPLHPATTADWRLAWRTAPVAPPETAADALARHEAQLDPRALLPGTTPGQRVAPVLTLLRQDLSQYPLEDLAERLRAEASDEVRISPSVRLWRFQLPWLLAHDDERMQLPVWEILLPRLSDIRRIGEVAVVGHPFQRLWKSITEVGTTWRRRCEMGQSLVADGAVWSPVHAVAAQVCDWSTLSLGTQRPAWPPKGPTRLALSGGLRELVDQMRPWLEHEPDTALLRHAYDLTGQAGGSPVLFAVSESAPRIPTRLQRRLLSTPVLYLAASRRGAIPAGDAFGDIVRSGVRDATRWSSSGGGDPWIRDAFNLLLTAAPPGQPPAWQLNEQTVRDLLQEVRAIQQRQQQGGRHAALLDPRTARTVNTWRQLVRWSGGRRDGLGAWAHETLEHQIHQKMDPLWGGVPMRGPGEDLEMDLLWLAVPHLNGRDWIRGLVRLMEAEADLEGATGGSAGRQAARIEHWISQWSAHQPLDRVGLTAAMMRPLLLHRNRVVRTRGIAVLGQIGMMAGAPTSPAPESSGGRTR